MKLVYKILIIFVLAVIVLISLKKMPQVRHSEKNNAAIPVLGTASKGSLRKLSRSLQQGFFPNSNSENRDNDQGPIEKVLRGLQSIKMSAEYFNASEVREKVFDTWAADPIILNAIVSVLTEPGRSHELHEVSQAELRYFGIQALAQMAKKGRPDLLDKVVKEIAENREAHQEIAEDVGRMADFKDLLFNKLNSMTPESVDNEYLLASFFQEFGLDKIENQKMKRALDDEVFFFLYPRIGKASAARILASVNPLEVAP